MNIFRRFVKNINTPHFWFLYRRETKMYISIWPPLEQFSFSTVTMATITMVTVVFLRVFTHTAVMAESRKIMFGKEIQG